MKKRVSDRIPINIQQQLIKRVWMELWPNDENKKTKKQNEKHT